MDASHLIAQMLGLIYVVVGVGVLMDSTRYTKLFSELQSNVALSYIGGVITLLCGYLIITFGPNTWTVSFEGLITLIGWVSLLKGVLFLVRPTALFAPAQFWLKNMQLASGICIVLGLTLGYYGFM